jgi:hypothetical protein
MSSKRKMYKEEEEKKKESVENDSDDELEAHGTFLLCNDPLPPKEVHPSLPGSTMFSTMKKVLESGICVTGQDIDDFSQENVFETKRGSQIQKIREKRD